ncbi:MAG: DUF58 domain-containing protein [Ardenticatenales bacterium]|nr:DUF58 domain-containing protein [Ardenticatenales bacterium]
MSPSAPAAVRLRLRARIPLVWLGLLLLIAILLPHRLWNMMLIGLGGLFLVAYIWARSLANHLSAERRLRYGWVGVGDRLLEEFQLHNDGHLPAIWVEILDESNVPGYQAAVVRSISSGQIRWQQEAICQQRGQFHLGPWGLVSADPFGIFEVRHWYPVADEIIIHPPIDSTLPIPLPAGRSSGRVRAPERAIQATINAAAIRDYQSGDPLRWIHWPSSARRQKLFVREFDLDASGDIWLLLDLEATAQLGLGSESTVEYGVLLAASLAARAVRANRAVGLAAFGAEPQLLPPARGMGQQWRLLRALALVQGDGQISLSRALADLARQASRGSAAVIITAQTDLVWLPDLLRLLQSGVQCNLVLLDRPSFGGAGDSTAAINHLYALGVEANLVQQGELQRAPAERERRGFWEFRTTATGRVIVVNRPVDEARSAP